MVGMQGHLVNMTATLTPTPVYFFSLCGSHPPLGCSVVHRLVGPHSFRSLILRVIEQAEGFTRHCEPPIVPPSGVFDASSVMCAHQRIGLSRFPSMSKFGLRCYVLG